MLGVAIELDQEFMTPFEPDGVYNSIPYRVLPDCSIEAMMPGGLVKFKNMDQLVATSTSAPADINLAHSQLVADAARMFRHRRDRSIITQFS